MAHSSSYERGGLEQDVVELRKISKDERYGDGVERALRMLVGLATRVLASQEGYR